MEHPDFSKETIDRMAASLLVGHHINAAETFTLMGDEVKERYRYLARTAIYAYFSMPFIQFGMKV